MCTFPFFFADSIDRVDDSISRVDNPIGRFHGVGSGVFVPIGMESIGDFFFGRVCTNTIQFHRLIEIF